jgi:hypothetical protein
MAPGMIARQIWNARDLALLTPSPQQNRTYESRIRRQPPYRLMEA